MRELNKQTTLLVSGGLGIAPFVWGGALGLVGYTVSNKYDFHLSGLIIAAVGSSLTGFFEPFGALGKVLQVANVAVTSEVVSYIQTEKW